MGSIINGTCENAKSDSVEQGTPSINTLFGLLWDAEKAQMDEATRADGLLAEVQGEVGASARTEVELERPLVQSGAERADDGRIMVRQSHFAYGEHDGRSGFLVRHYTADDARRVLEWQQPLLEASEEIRIRASERIEELLQRLIDRLNSQCERDPTAKA